MPYQSGQNVSVRYKVQGALGTPASGSGGKELPLIPSGGLVPSKAAIESPAVRSDGMTDVGRHGSRSVAGEYGAVARLGATDELLEAVMRSTWTATDTLNEADFTSITTGTDTIVLASGSPISLGVRVGDVIRLADHSTAANNGKWIPVVGLSATTITVPANSLTANAVADSDVDIIIAKKLGMGTTKRYFTFDEYHADIDQSESFTDCVISSLGVAQQPDDSVRLSFGIVGIDFAANATGASPVLTDPTTYESPNLVATDAVILKDGVAVTDVTGLSFSLDTRASTLPVIGSTTSPDVFQGNARISGSLSIPRADLTYLSHFDDEDELSLFVMLREPESDPRDFISFYFPVVKLMSAPDAALGGDGPMISTINFVAGKKPTTSGYLDTMLHIASSAA